MHVPVPVPIPVKVHEEKHHHSDHWGSSSNSHEDNWASASSMNDEIKPHKSIKVSAASVPPHRSFNLHNHLMARMENGKLIEQKSTILQTLLNNNDKPNRSDKKNGKSEGAKKKTGNSSDKHQEQTKDSSTITSPQLISHLVDPNMQTQEMLPPPSAFSLMSHPENMQPNLFMNPNPNFLGPISINPNEMHQHLHNQQQLPQPTLEQQQQLYEAIQQRQLQMQQQFEQHLQNEHQKMQESIAISNSIPQQLPNDSPLASQLPIPLPGQMISAPVFEPINNSVNQSSTNNVNNINDKVNNNMINDDMMNNQPMTQAQFNELEIIPYEVQQQLQAAAHLRQFMADSNLKDSSNRENSLTNYNKEHNFKEQQNNKNKHLLKGNYSNLIRTITIKPNYLKYICLFILFIILKSIILI